MSRFSGYVDDKLYIPLSEQSAEALTVDGDALAFLDKMSDAEIASVLVIQSIPGFDQKHGVPFSAERLLAKLISWGCQNLTRGSLLGEAKRLFDQVSFEAGLSQVSSGGVEFLSQEDVDVADYLLADGTWDYEFRIRHYNKVAAFKIELGTPRGKLLVLSAPQDLIVKAFLAEKDESFHVQGYAGTGKTHLISSLVKFMDAEKTLVLAQTQTQLYQLTARLKNGKVAAKTFMAMAGELLAVTRPYLTEAALDYLRLSDGEIARVLNIGSVGALSPTRVVGICRRAVKKYCRGADKRLEKWHLPYINDALSTTDVSVLVQYATRIWEATISPPIYEVRFPVQGFHLVKCLSLTGDVIPEIYSHVIVDESHDLSRAVLEVLDRSPQAVITLGDEYQCISGPVFKRSKQVRQRDITLSVRAGRSMESVLNPLIDAHPSKIKLHFEGGANNSTKVVRYSGSQVPDKPTTILVESEWGMFEWFQRLSHAKVRFALIHGSKRSFIDFMTDCINLYHRGTPPKHRILYFHVSWASLAQSQSHNKSFEKVEAMLLKGYDVDKLKLSLLSLEDMSSGGYQLGMVEHARNAEFDSVMLAPDMLNDLRAGDVLGFDRKVCALYTGGSRAMHELLVPGELDGWVESYKLALPRLR